jgi:mevalonate kinase
MTWQPHWYLSYCGHRGVTADCIDRVKAMAETEPESSYKLDVQMQEAVLEAQAALRMPKGEGLPKLAKAINKARGCFEFWGLVEGGLERHMHQLLQEGALAVKPTGSGGGGYVLSLWSTEQVLGDLELRDRGPARTLLPCF